MMGFKIEAMQGAPKKISRETGERCCVYVCDIWTGFLFRMTQRIFVILPPREVRVQWFSNKQTDLVGLLKNQIPGSHPSSF